MVENWPGTTFRQKWSDKQWRVQAPEYTDNRECEGPQNSNSHQGTDQGINQCNDRDIDTAVAPSKETNSKTCDRFLTMQLLFKSLFLNNSQYQIWIPYLFFKLGTFSLIIM